jgi:hypothetical protein
LENSGGFPGGSSSSLSREVTRNGLGTDLAVMVTANGRGPGRWILVQDPGILPAPGTARDAVDARPEEIPGDEVDLPDTHQDHSCDEKLEMYRTYHFTTLQSFPKRPRRTKRTSNRSEMSV